MICLLEVYGELSQLFPQPFPLQEVEFDIDLSKKFILRASGTHIVKGVDYLQVNRRQLLDALLHEMVHISNKVRGVEDHTANQYHKKEFCDLALKVGLYVVQTQNRGWGVTTSSSKALPMPHRVPEDEDCLKRERIYRKFRFDKELAEEQVRLKEQMAGKLSKQYQFKYICGCPSSRGNSVRSGRRPEGESAFNATCNVCGKKFEYVEKGG